jgi:hypothetical protein
MAELVVLVGIGEMGGRDLGHLVAQDVGLAGPLLLVAAERLDRGVQGAQPRSQLVHGFEVRARVGIENGALRRRRDQ